MNKIKTHFREIIVITFVVILMVSLPRLEPVRYFLTSNVNGFILFLAVFVILHVRFMVKYGKTLGPYEEESEASGRAMKKNVGNWIVFWCLWSSYCALITITIPQISWQLLLTAAVLAIVPGLFSFFSASSQRKEVIKQEENEKERLGEAYFKEPPYTMFPDRKYFAGYYGLLCIPVYTGLLIVWFVFRELQ